MDNFFNVYEIKSVHSLHAPVVFKLFGWPVGENIKYKDFDCFYENTYEFWNLYRKLYQNSSQSLVSFLHVITSYWTGEKSD